MSRVRADLVARRPCCRSSAWRRCSSRTPTPVTAATDERREPTHSALTSASVVCPSPVGRQTGDRRRHDPDRRERARSSRGSATTSQPVTRRRRRRLSSVPRDRRPGRGHRRRRPGAVPGRRPVAGRPARRDRLPSARRRSSGSPASARARPTARSSSWSTRTPAGPSADVLLWSQAGPLDVPELLGVSVPGGESVRLDLAEIVPRRGELMAQVTTSRGRLAVDVADSVDELGTGLVAADWLSPQPEPTTSNLLLGLARARATASSCSATPATTRCARRSRSSRRAPSSRRPTWSRSWSPPGRTKPVTLTTLLDEAADQGAIGLLVESTGPVTANLRQTAGGRPVGGRARGAARHGDRRRRPGGQGPAAAGGRRGRRHRHGRGAGRRGQGADDRDGRARPRHRCVASRCPDGTALVTAHPRADLGPRGPAASTDDTAGTAVVRCASCCSTGSCPTSGPCCPEASGQLSSTSSRMTPSPAPPLSRSPTLSPTVAVSSTLRNISTPVTVVVPSAAPARRMPHLLAHARPSPARSGRSRPCPGSGS